MSRAQFKSGDLVKVLYWEPALSGHEALVLKVVKHLPHPSAYEGVMDEVYEMSDGSVLKERYLTLVTREKGA